MTNWFIWFKFDLRKIFNEKLFYLLTVCLFVVFRLSECHDWGPTRERDRRLDLERFLLFRLESQHKITWNKPKETQNRWEMHKFGSGCSQVFTDSPDNLSLWWHTAKDASLPSSRADSARASNKVVPTDPPTFQCRRNMSWEKYDSGLTTSAPTGKSWGQRWGRIGEIAGSQIGK